MRRNEKITKIMTAEPVTAQVGQTVSEVSKMMQDGGFHHVPVLEGKRLVGIVTSTDLLRVSYEYGMDARQTDTVLDHTVDQRDLMQAEPRTLTVHKTVREAVEYLAEGHYHSIPVIDDSGDLAGIVTTTDVLRYLLEQY